MKSILGFLALWAALAGTAVGQTLAPEKVPAKVRDAFRARFPDVTKVEWTLKSDKNYEAEFELKDAEVTAKFNDHGKWLETETAFEQSALPKELLAEISNAYKGYRIIETQKVERADDKPILFEVHLENAKEILKVQLEANGTIASKSTKRKKGA